MSGDLFIFIEKITKQNVQGEPSKKKYFYSMLFGPLQNYILYYKIILKILRNYRKRYPEKSFRKTLDVAIKTFFFCFIGNSIPNSYGYIFSL